MNNFIHTFNNEILLLLSAVLLYSSVLIWYKLFGTQGLFAWTVFSTITANIEVLILVDAFGIEQTLGNVMFATTFLVTDILSETKGKQLANKAVNIGIATAFSLVLVSQLWLLFSPSTNDWAFESIQTIFSVTPRLVAVSLIVYAICQKFDVWVYHKIWNFTKEKTGDSKKYLWLRNNGSTMISQLLNAILFSTGAFWGLYPIKVVISIIISSYVIFLLTAIFDTPVIYIARYINNNKEN